MEQIILPLTLFALSMCITPGPNNMMLTASAANFGFKRTIPHLLGIEVGLLFMFFLCAFGLGLLFEQVPVVQSVMKYCSIGYLLYLSVRIALSKRSAGDGYQQGAGKPLNIYQAALFQLVNPKAFLMAITAMSTFSIAGQDYYLSVTLIMVVFGVVCIPSISVWAGFGTVIGKVLKDERAFRVFNVCMGVLTASSVFQML